MTDHLSSTQIADYSRQQLLPPEVLRVDDHLAACAACRLRIEAALPSSVLSLHAELQTGATASHPPFAQLAAAVDGALHAEEKAALADHLASCAQCAATADDLRAFVADAPRPVTQDDQPSWWRGLRAWWSWPMPAWGAALLLVGVLSWWLFAPRPAPPVLVADKPVVAGDLSPSPVSTPEAPVLARLNDSDRQITLDRAGQLSGADDLPATYQEMIKEALATERLPRAVALAGLQRPASSLMGADEAGNQFALVAPVGKVVLNGRPAFRWTPLRDATGYVVEIYDDQFNMIASGEEVKSNEWRIARTLAPGRVYTWQVKAFKGGQEVVAPKPPAPQARFKVLDRRQANELERARRTHPSAHLMLGLLYARAGLFEEAERELQLLQRANPDAPVARRLLSDVRSLRP